MVSSHIFIFPFEWKHTDSAQKLFEEQTSLKPIAGLFAEDSRWVRKTRSALPTSKSDYNDTTYFYEFVRPALYDTGEESTLLQQYKMSCENTLFVIEKDSFSAELKVASIELRLYGMGVGTVSVFLHNEGSKHTDPDSLLKINQYGRRLFPPFYQISHPDAGEEAYYTEKTWKEGLERHPELPDRLVLKNATKTLWEETYKSYQQQPNLNQPPDLLQYLLPKTFLESMSISPVLDDRMYVLCWYENTKVSESVKKDITSNDWWYRYVFVDAARTVHHAETMHDLLKKHTYPRWADFGTFFGVTRYSFVGVAAEGAPVFLAAHMRTMYAQMAELALVQRACVLRFSEEVSNLSSLASRDGKLPARMESIFRQYIRFLNKYNIREVSAQEQGIELYDLIRQSMRLPEQIAILEKEIGELHQYASTIAEDRRNEKLDIITYLGAVFGVPSFIATMYGVMKYEIDKHPWWPVMWVYLFAVGSTIGIAKSQNPKVRNVSIAVLIFVLVVGVLLIPFWNL